MEMDIALTDLFWCPTCGFRGLFNAEPTTYVKCICGRPPNLTPFSKGGQGGFDRKVPRKPPPSGRGQGAQYDETTLPESPPLRAGSFTIIFEAAEIRRKKEKPAKSFNPKKYKMACCPHCKGTGKSPYGDEGVKICSQCGGFGWIKKEGVINE